MLRLNGGVDYRVIKDKIVRGLDACVGGRAVTNPVVSHQTVGNNVVECRRSSRSSGVVVEIDIAPVVIADVSQRQVVRGALLEEDAIAHQVVAVIEFHHCAEGTRIAVHAVLVDVGDFVIRDQAFLPAQLQPDTPCCAAIDGAARHDVWRRAASEMNHV